MSAPSQPAANAPESATVALYRAALGPVNTARYLALFDRFDDAGRATPVWNWAAGLITLNWLAFRQMWLAALVYVAFVGGLVLLILGLARRFLQWPPAVEWGVLGALLALCIAIPGAYGSAWLHADTRRRMTRAVREARTVREACETLERQASTRRRLWALAVLNVLLAAALVAGYLAWTRALTAPTSVSSEPVPAAVEPPPPAAVEPPPPAVPVEEAPASAPAEPDPPAEPAAAAASEPMPAAVETPPAPPAPAASEPVVAVPPILAPVPKPPVPKPPVPKPPVVEPAAVAPSTRGFAINVGLFADPANAEKAHARLMEAGLPAFMQTMEMPKGERTRLRVGPFENRAQAEAAAERIRALDLDAQIYQP